MKWLSVCLLLLFSSWTVAYGLDSAWILVRKQDDVKVWLHSKDKAVTGSILISKKNDEQLSLSNEQQKYFQLLEQQKKSALSFFGISEWTAGDYTWKQQENFHELTLAGTYKDALGRIIKFREIHEFHKSMTVQILFSQPIDSIISPDVSEQFIKQARKDFGAL